MCAAECRDGLPDHGRYGELLASADSPAALMARILASPETVPDQWQVQVQARVQATARVLLRADGLSDEQVRGAHLEPIADVSRAVAEIIATRPDARVCVLPQGPQTIPYVSGVRAPSGDAVPHAAKGAGPRPPRAPGPARMTDAPRGSPPRR
jgi:lactate racemase